ncbi:hypothetical protein EXS66_02435 [Candidatus Saccharibacteria bacterium]|nr:hypothetical protein [Candidatus Saccharibacteria bacterium]
MSIKVNLLPEARLVKLKNQAKKRSYSAIAGLIGGIIGAIIIVLIMLRVFLASTFDLGTTKINSLNAEISKSKTLEQNASTLQANLATFYALNSSRTHVTRTFSNFFRAVPDNVAISSIAIDGPGVVTVTGTTTSFADVSKFAYMLELYNLNYLPQPDLERKAVFTDVSILSVNKGTVEGTTNVSFTMTFKVNQEVLEQSESK